MVVGGLSHARTNRPLALRRNHHASHDLAPAAETDNHLVVYERRCLDLYDLCNMCDALKLLVMLAFLSVLAAPVVVWVVAVVY